MSIRFSIDEPAETGLRTFWCWRISLFRQFQTNDPVAVQFTFSVTSFPSRLIR